MTERRELRIGDAERAAAADELAEHYAQGRLTTEEHHERLDRLWAARTPSELSVLFTDLPGSAYRMPPSYATADRPGVGADRPRIQRPIPGRPFPGRPFGRPPYADRGRGVARRFGLLPVVVRIALVALLAVLVVAHLPLILLGLVIWLVLTHKFRHAHAHQRRW